MSGESDFILKTFADGTNYSFRRRFSSRLNMRQNYLSVTSSGVTRPVLTVAVALTGAKPGADTATV
jgi:hypothetical protein